MIPRLGGLLPLQVAKPVTTFTAEPTGGPEPLSNKPRGGHLPLWGALSHIPAMLQPLNDPLHDPLERRPVAAQATHPVRHSTLLQPLGDPLYRPQCPSTPGCRPPHPPRAASVKAAPPGPRCVAAQNCRFPKQQRDPPRDPAAVETVPGPRTSLIEASRLAPLPLPRAVFRQGPHPPAAMYVATPGQNWNSQHRDYSSRPVLRGKTAGQYV